MAIESLDIAQKTLFGDDERVATKESIVEAVLQVMPRGDYDAEQEARVTEMIAALYYPAYIKRVKLAAEFYGKIPITKLALQLLAIEGDHPHPETIARMIRKVKKKKPYLDPYKRSQV